MLVINVAVVSVVDLPVDVSTCSLPSVSPPVSPSSKPLSRVSLSRLRQRVENWLDSALAQNPDPPPLTLHEPNQPDTPQLTLHKPHPQSTITNRDPRLKPRLPSLSFSNADCSKKSVKETLQPLSNLTNTNKGFHTNSSQAKPAKFKHNTSAKSKVSIRSSLSSPDIKLLTTFTKRVKHEIDEITADVCNKKKCSSRHSELLPFSDRH